jgi:RND family efflux transporter, MFP subunit
MNRIRPPYIASRIFYFLVLLSVALSGCRQKQNDDDTGQQPVKVVVTVKVDKVREHDAMLTVSALGRTDALRKEKIYSPLAGKIVSLKVYEGTEVKKGDVVAVIQSKESNATILGAEAMVRSASTPELKTEAERVLQLAKSTQNSVNVQAKFDGVVSTRNVSEGELVVENGELLTIIDLSTVGFLADVSTHDLASVKTGQPVSILFQSIPDKEFPAIVDAINPQTDIQSQTVKVRLRFLPANNSLQSPLRTDIVGRASIVTGIRHHALFVPKTALLRDDENNSYSVVTMTDDSLAMTIPVSIGASSDSSVEILGKGLHAGIPVITEGNYSLADSTRVTVARQD